jgi:hypothetical protein
MIQSPPLPTLNYDALIHKVKNCIFTDILTIKLVKD